MPLGTTNISIEDIYVELQYSASDLSLADVQEVSWVDGPGVGVNNSPFAGFGFRSTSFPDDQLFNPVNEAGTLTRSSNYRMAFAKNFQAFMDQTNYRIRVDIDNQLAGMMDNFSFDVQLWDETLTYGPIAGQAFLIPASTNSTNNFADAPSTFNVYYGYFKFTWNVQDPMTNYGVNIDVNGATYNVGGLSGGGSYSIDYTSLSSTPINDSAGFIVSVTVN